MVSARQSSKNSNHWRSAVTGHRLQRYTRGGLCRKQGKAMVTNESKNWRKLLRQFRLHHARHRRHPYRQRRAAGPGRGYLHAQPFGPCRRERGRWLFSRQVRIASRVWIGTGCHLNPGVTIGDVSIIGSGSVVTKDIPPGVIAAGVPCRVGHAITDADKTVFLPRSAPLGTAKSSDGQAAFCRPA